jgi:1,4-alpha-glucan branching enzyme
MAVAFLYSAHTRTACSRRPFRKIPRIFEVLGAHLTEHERVTGTCFAVWAPNAHNVNLIGDFNAWDGRSHPMRSRGASGVWELFVPGIRAGALYKYEIRTADGQRLDKADPVGFAMELRPATASEVADVDRYEWGLRGAPRVMAQTTRP